MTRRRPPSTTGPAGRPAFDRLTEVFYGRVREDDVARRAVFAHLPEDHPRHVATWLAEVFGGPPEYTERHGGYGHMVASTCGLALTEEQRGRWVDAHPGLRRRGRPARRPRVPLGLRRLRRVGHATRAGQLPARRDAAARGARAAVGLGRGAALRRRLTAAVRRARQAARADRPR